MKLGDAVKKCRQLGSSRVFRPGSPTEIETVKNAGLKMNWKNDKVWIGYKLSKTGNRNPSKQEFIQINKHEAPEWLNNPSFIGKVWSSSSKNIIKFGNRKKLTHLKMFRGQFTLTKPQTKTFKAKVICETEKDFGSDY